MNRVLFDTSIAVESYESNQGLTPCEAAIVQAHVAKGSRVLDLGVGTGRTCEPLSTIASTYVGVDYAARMVQEAKRRFPYLDLRVADATDLHDLGERAFDVVVFSFNGLDYVHPATKRAEALRGFARVLDEGGVLIFSTHNPRHVIRVPTPAPEPGVSSAGTLRRMAIAIITTLRAFPARVATRAFWTGAGYARDRPRPYLTYFATPSHVRDELEANGFGLIEIVCSDHPTRSPSWRTPWYYYVARKVSEDLTT